MSRSTDVKGAASRRITCPPNTVTEIPAISGQLAQQLKLVSGGTLEIGGSTVTQLAVGASFNQMYYLSQSEIFSWNNSGSLFLWASGATCVVAVIDGRSASDFE